jgi:hypothetical protein
LEKPGSGSPAFSILRANRFFSLLPTLFRAILPKIFETRIYTLDTLNAMILGRDEEIWRFLSNFNPLIRSFSKNEG